MVTLTTTQKLEQNKKEITSLTAQVSDLTEKLKSATEKLNAALAEVETLKTSNVAKSQFDELQTKFTELTTKHDELVKNQKTAEMRALEIVQQSGTPAVPVAPTTPQSTAGDLLSQYDKLSNDPVAQRNFWNKNRDALLGQYRGR